MLPSDAKERKAAEHVTLQQTQVNDHFAKALPDDKPPPYTDELFKEAAIEWLIQTDQVSFCFKYKIYYPNLSILAHPSLRTSLIPKYDCYSGSFNQRGQDSEPETDACRDYLGIQEANDATSGTSEC